MPIPNGIKKFIEKQSSPFTLKISNFGLTDEDVEELVELLQGKTIEFLDLKIGRAHV